MSRHRRHDAASRLQWRGLLFVAPGFALYATLILYPALRTVNLSLFDWDGINASSWVGFQNYRDVFTDQILRNSIVHAVILIVFFSFVPICMGLVIAALLARGKRRGMAAFRLVFFLPQVLPLVAVGIIWRWMYSADGVVNQVLGLVGIHSETAWLGSWNWALPAVGLIGAWVQSGLCMMLFLAGAQKIDGSLYEAARLDGAGAIREFFAVTLPGLRAEVGLALTVTVISALASFDIVYVTTNGSPSHRTDVPGLLVYRNMVVNNDVGHAAALAVVLSAIVVLAALTANRLSRVPEAS